MSSKAKGSRGEREVVALLREWWKDDSFVRAPESGALSTVMEGTNAPRDVVGRLAGDILAPPDFPFCVEVKFYKDIDLWQTFKGTTKSQLAKWWKQVVNDAERSDRWPLLFFKANHKPWMVAVRDWVLSLGPEPGTILYTVINLDRVAILTFKDFSGNVNKDAIRAYLEND